MRNAEGPKLSSKSLAFIIWLARECGILGWGTQVPGIGAGTAMHLGGMQCGAWAGSGTSPARLTEQNKLYNQQEQGLGPFPDGQVSMCFLSLFLLFTIIFLADKMASI